MKNDIIRKLTSLTLMSIMVAGGLTFAIPSALPQAAAETAQDGPLIVSTTEFGGEQVLEIRLADPAIRDVSVIHTEPVVEIGGNAVDMVHATTGDWYAYVADQGTSDVTIAAATAPKMVDGTATGHHNSGDTITDIDRTNDFDGDGEDLDVTYKDYTVTVKFADDLSGSTSVGPDRSGAPRGATVHITITDTRLNLDPTTEDTWTLDVNTTNTDTVDLGHGHGVLVLSGSLVNEDGDNPAMVTFEETGVNTGEFTNVDTAPIKIADDALTNLEVGMSYAAGDPSNIIVRDESFDISITADDFWSSGETVTVTLVAPNLNLNTEVDETIELTADRVPTIEINSPLTLEDTGATVDPESRIHTYADDDANSPADTITFNFTTSIAKLNNTLNHYANYYSSNDASTFQLEYNNGTDHDVLEVTTAGESDTTSLDVAILNESEGDGTLVLTVTDAADGDKIIFDILSFGDDEGTVVNDAIYRHLLEETDEGGVFEGTLEYVMLNQINIADPETYNAVTTQSDALVLIIDGEYSGNDLQISYGEETARVEIATSGGTVSLDADSYSTNGSVSVTLIDQDLNVDNDATESYTLMPEGDVRGAKTDAKLLEFKINDRPWVDCTDKDGDARGLGLPDAFTLEESADEPGTFTASFDIPTTYCDGSDDPETAALDANGVGAVTGKSLQATYTDFRDDTGIATTWSDSATIQAVTGTVSIDRNVYPVPAKGSPVVVHIEISDPDSNTDSDVLDKIQVGAIPAVNEDDNLDNDVDNDSTVRVEITPVSASSPDDISFTEGDRTTIGLGADFEETSEDSGVFSQTIEIPYDILGSGDDDLIQQSYILSVIYKDPSDATGEESETTDSAIFNIGTATLSTDTTEYALKQTAFVTLVDHDSNYDSDTREIIDLDRIEWEGSSDTDLSNSAAFDASPPFLRETEANSGIFLTEITIPEVIKERVDDTGDAVERGESVTLTYTDYSPAGADRPGLDDRSVETGFTILRTGASLTLDKDVYSWRDRVTITVVAPDFNIDSLAVESIGTNDEVQIRSQLDSDTATLTETGPNTGIFQGTVDLGGFKYEVANNVMAQPANLLQVGSEDGISVTFTYDEDERDLIQSALIRWNVAEVTWVEDSYREGATGTLRVVDIDRNLHPDTPDSIETIVFSDTYRGGIRVALTETEPASGVFEGEVIFDVLHSEGNRLQVSEGDIVTAAYDDATLPPPDDGDDLRVTGTTTVGSIVPPLERVAVSNLGVVDALGSAVDSISVGQQVNIAADLTSAQSRSQDYAYLLQIQNMDGVTVHLSWAASSLAGFGGANVSQSWTPDETGSYTATVFVWESLTNPTALSPQNSIDITVV